MRYAAELPVNNNSVTGLHSEYLEAERTLEENKASGLGLRHPTMQAMTERHIALRSDLEESVVTLRESLATNYEMIS